MAQRLTLLVAVGAYALCGVQSFAEEPPSTVVLPVSLNLAAAQERLNQEVPQVLYSIDEKIECVPAKWFKTKFPPIKTKITPEINCQINGVAQRTGPITIAGAGQQIVVSVPVHASVTGRGTGDIGKHIRETAEAAATLTVVATPSIDPDWNVGLTVDHSVQWTQKPTIVLFGLFSVTFTNLVDPEIQKAINKQKEKLPGLIGELKVREKVEKAWRELQKPMKIAEKPEMWLTFKPSGVGFSGLNTENNVLKARVGLSGMTDVHLGPAPIVEPVALLPLSPDVPIDGSFNLTIPIILPLPELQALANKELAELEPIKVGDLHELTLSDVKFSEHDGALAIELEALLDNKGGWLDWFDVFNWFDVSGTVYLKARPVIDDERRIVTLADLDFNTATSSLPVDALVDTLRLVQVKRVLEALVKYEYGKDVDKAKTLANAQLNRRFDEGLALSGSLEGVGVRQPVVTSRQLTLPFALSGNLQVSFGLN